MSPFNFCIRMFKFFSGLVKPGAGLLPVMTAMLYERTIQDS